MRAIDPFLCQFLFIPTCTITTKPARPNALELMCLLARSRLLPAALGVAALSFVLGEANAMTLITAQEAALPDAPGLQQLDKRGVTRGPKILVLSPAPDAGVVRSPVNLLLKFETYGGAAIDPLSVKVTYLKTPAINLTQRISTSVTPNGIEVRAAEAPPGTHYIRVEVKDSAGRVSSIIFPLMVAN
jgi:hypothetical protein